MRHFLALPVFGFLFLFGVMGDAHAGPAVRQGDHHTCPMVTGLVPHVGGPILAGEPTVLICGMPAATLGKTASCAGPPDTIVSGSSTVLVRGAPAARRGDRTAHGGIITGAGCPTVLIGP